MQQLKMCLSVLALAFFMTACQQDTLENVDYLNGNENLEERALCKAPSSSEITFGNGSYINLYVYAFDFNGTAHQIRWRVRSGSSLFTNWEVLPSNLGYYDTLDYMECSEYQVQMRVHCKSGPNKWSAWSQTATKFTGSPNVPNPC